MSGICFVCGERIKGNICSCGYDETKDYERYKTLSNIPANIVSGYKKRKNYEQTVIDKAKREQQEIAKCELEKITREKEQLARLNLEKIRKEEEARERDQQQKQREALAQQEKERREREQKEKELQERKKALAYLKGLEKEAKEKKSKPVDFSDIDYDAMGNIFADLFKKGK